MADKKSPADPSITTGATTTTITPIGGSVVYHVTSGGTGGVENIVLAPVPDAPGFSGENPDVIPTIVTIALETQTNPTDVVKVWNGEVGLEFETKDAAANQLAITVGGVVLDYADAVGMFSWDVERWNFRADLCDFNNDAVLNPTVFSITYAAGAAPHTVMFTDQTVVGFRSGATVPVASLPTAPLPGTRAFVIDALAPLFGAIVVGGGTVGVPVYADDVAAWRVG